jgi:hypothetical protein
MTKPGLLRRHNEIDDHAQTEPYRGKELVVSVLHIKYSLFNVWDKVFQVGGESYIYTITYTHIQKQI